MIKPGHADNFRALTREMIESSRREAGVLCYERFVSENGSVVYAYERYADSAAALAHLQENTGSTGRNVLTAVRLK